MFSVKNFILPVLLVPLVIGGCGDSSFEFLDNKDSPQAARENAKMLMDEQKYDEAVTIMVSQCGGSETQCKNADDAQLLAAAYMGASGLDVLDFIKNAEDPTALGANAGSDFRAIAVLFPAYDTATAKGGLSMDDFTKIDKAVQVLCNIGGSTNCPDATLTALNNDQSLQLTIAQAAAGVIAMGVDPTTPSGTTTGGYDMVTGVPVSCTGGNAACEPSETLSIIQNAAPTVNAFNVSSVGGYVTATLGNTILSLNNIEQFVDAEVAQMINDLIVNMDTGSCTVDGAVQVTDLSNLTGGAIDTTELQNYLQGCL